MRNLYISVLLTLVACTACTREETLPLPHVQPFSELSDVRVGMTAGDLRDLRPVEFAPYTGLSEKWGGGTILYHIDGTVTDHAQPSDRNTVNAVTFSRFMPDQDDLAVAEYERVTQEWVTVLGEPDCNASGGPVSIAVWRQGGLHLTASRTATSKPVTIAAVRLSVTRDSSALADCKRRELSLH